jgi:hypothetical protein
MLPPLTGCWVVGTCGRLSGTSSPPAEDAESSRGATILSMPTPPLLVPGHYRLSLTCRHCGFQVEVPVQLDTRTTSDSGGGTLRAKLVGKPLPHDCRQLALVPAQPADTAGGGDPDQVPGQLPLAGDGDRPVDWAEAAAGGRRPGRWD